MLAKPDVGRGRIAAPADILAYVEAGNATFTLQGSKERFTYRVRASENGEVSFVSLLTGPDNEADYVYVGVIRDRAFALTKKSRLTSEAPAVRAFAWFWGNLARQDAGQISKVEFFHEGRCGRCNRKLTVPASVARGIGPECAGIMMECA